MKSIFVTLAWLTPIVVIAWVAFNPDTGLVFQSPTAALGVGLIGLGLCKHVRDREQPARTKTQAKV